ncbi:anti-sigma factor [Kocuria sp. U4B]
MNESHDVHDSAALYAVDALEPEERARFEEHLRECPSCRREVAEYAEVGAHLAGAVAQEPPPSLREDVLAGIRATAPLPAPAPSAATAPVVSLEERRRRPGRRPGRWLAAAAAAVLVPSVALGGWALGVRGEQRQQEQLAAQAQQEQARENQLLAAPDVVTRTLELDGRTATVVASQQAGAALVVSAGLPDPGEGQEYQLWLMQDDVPVPDVHFAGGEVRTWLEGDVADAAAVAMTVEPAGGSASPTLPVVALAEL